MHIDFMISFYVGKEDIYLQKAFKYDYGIVDVVMKQKFWSNPIQFMVESSTWRNLFHAVEQFPLESNCRDFTFVTILLHPIGWILAEFCGKQLLCWWGLRFLWSCDEDGDTELLFEDECLQSSSIVWHSCELQPNRSCLLWNHRCNWSGENISPYIYFFKEW